MFRYIKLYSLLWAQNIQAKMEYKFDFLLGNLATILGQVAGIAFVWVIFQRIGDLNGWRLPEIMLIYGIAALPFGLCELLFNGLWKLTYFIRMGEFDRLLVRPVGPLFFILSEETAPHGLGNFLTGVVIIIKASRDLQLRWDVIQLGILALMVVCGTLIYMAINLITATCSFWIVGARSSIMFMVQRLRDFSSYPLPIYALPLRILLTWLVPFAFTGFFPATFFLERQEFAPFVYLIPVVTVAFLSLAYGFWRLGVNNYQSTGS